LLYGENSDPRSEISLHKTEDQIEILPYPTLSSHPGFMCSCREPGSEVEGVLQPFLVIIMLSGRNGPFFRDGDKIFQYIRRYIEHGIMNGMGVFIPFGVLTDNFS
jgi:hypothetical protein